MNAAVESPSAVTETITIEVTEHDIAAGTRCHGANCPIAIAASRALIEAGRGDLLPVDVGFDLMLFNAMTRGARGTRIPRSAATFVQIYDKGFKVQPVSFTVEIPAKDGA